MTKRLMAAVCVMLFALGTPVWTADKKKAEPTENYDEIFAKYLEAARKQAAIAAPDPGSWMNSLMADPRARRVNDLITVRVVESISASGTADAATSKTGSASIGVAALGGLEKKLPAGSDPTANVVGIKHDAEFKGAGSTNRASDLTATITARVSEVLPNGDLVVEGVRAITINGENQIVVLSGVVRVADIAPGNIVASSSLGQLQIKYFGRGLMKDNLSPGFLVRFMNKIF